MDRKLLNITLRKNIVFSILVLLVFVPVFYVLLGHMYEEETDDAMLLHHKEFVQNTSNILTPQDILSWNKINRDVKLTRSSILIEEKFNTIFVYDSLDQELEPYRQLVTQVTINGENYKYVEQKNLIESEDIILNIAMLFTSILILLLVGFILITKRMSSKLWKPFYATLETIENFEIDKNSDHNLTATNIEEFNRLNWSIEKLIERNSKIFKVQREFVENAAHELQTPLAVFQSKIDNLIQKEGLSEEYYQCLDSLSSSIINIKRLNKNLLLLTSLENNGFELKEKVNTATLFNNNINFFKDQALSRSITLQSEISENACMNGNQMLIDILISNLIMNAIKHNKEEGKIWVELSINSILVKNTGVSRALNQDKIFNRFEKTAGSNSGNGLGLAIVKRIVELNDWTISYTFENNLHIFTVKN